METTRYHQDWLQWEVSNQWTRKEVKFPIGTNLPSGAVVGIVTATNEGTQFDPTAADGSEIVEGIIWESIENNTEAIYKTVIFRGPCRVVDSRLTFVEGISQANRDAAIAALKAKEIEAIFVPKGGLNV